MTESRGVEGVDDGVEVGGRAFKEAPKPIDDPEDSRELMIRSSPMNAPAKMKRIFEVSIVYCSLFDPCPAVPKPSLPPRSKRSEPLD